MKSRAPVSEQPPSRAPGPVTPGSARDEDLVAALLAPSARRTEAVRALAVRILDHVGGMAGLAGATREQLTAVKGVDRARAERLLAAVEISKRAQEARLELGDAIRHPAEVARSVLARHGGANREVFGVLLLDVKNRPRGYRVVSVGTLDQSLVHPREAFRAAVNEGAAKVIFFHNHPSGDPSPSDEDVTVTKRLCEVGRTLGIPVLDHIIVGDGSRYVSLKEKNLL